MNKDQAINTFKDGMNLDISDSIMPSTFSRFNQNVRIVDLKGSSFVATFLDGNETLFQLTAGFVPVATQEFNNVLYIVSWCSHPASPDYKKIELGSYPSPNYSNPGNVNDVISVYRPLNNLDAAEFRTSAYDIETKPKIQKLEIQPDYDESVNLCFTIAGKIPRIVNSKFKVDHTSASLAFALIADRPSAATSNEYSTSTVDKETSLILFSDRVLKIALDSVSSGGKLKPGNYVYVFQYMTEDFNKTGIVGQSLICQVAHGNSANTLRGGDETEETSKRVTLALSNVDTDFSYLKVYLVYSSGQGTVTQQTLEFTQPITVTGESMSFTHSGFEELAAVSADTVNLDHAYIAAVEACTQINGYFILAGIKQENQDYTVFKDAAASITAAFAVKDIIPSALPGYADPQNVYNYVGGMGGESYPYGIVYVLPGNKLSPVFPIEGKVFVSNGDESLAASLAQKDGIITFPSSSNFRSYKDGKIRVKHLKLNLAGVPDNVREASLGFFIVRGERRPWILTQALVIPTLRVPPIEYTKYGGGDGGEQYYDRYPDGEATGRYKCIPCIDNLLEAYELTEIGTSTDPVGVIDTATFTRVNGYMPIFVNDMKEIDGAMVENFPADRWAMISGEALVDEPGYIPLLQRDSPYVLQLAKINFTVNGQIPDIYTSPVFAGSTVAPEVGLHYEIDSLDNTNFIAAVAKKVGRLDYVIAETFATGSEFGSKVIFRLKYLGENGAGHSRLAFTIHQFYNSYFGLKMEDALIDSSKLITNPRAGNLRIGANFLTEVGANGRSHTSGTRYSNYGSTVPGGFLVNVYPDNLLPYELESPGQYKNRLYETIDTVSYRQISPWIEWSDLPTSGPMADKLDVFGGDCYIGKVYHKLNQSGFRNPALATGSYKGGDIDAGIMVSWYQESKHNLALRQPVQFDASESEKRSFFPFVSRGDFQAFRTYRLPETLNYSQGYSETLTPKTLFAPPSLAPFVANDFFTRALYSERHIPNAFKNGFRSFVQSAFMDYDSAMGKIVAVFNHRGRLLFVFEHGIGMTEIDRRIQTGADAGGAIFVEPKAVLERGITYLSREIGCQDHLSLIQTPSAIYGQDRSRDKHWQIRDVFKVISDEGVASYLKTNPLTAPITGYDPTHNEVIFGSANYVLCFREGLEKYTSFYTLEAANLFARRGKELYSFIGRQAWRHGASGYTIYSENKKTIIEFVVNKNVQLAKVVDYLNLVSNETEPESVECYSYNQTVQVGATVNVGALNQYTKVEAGLDPVRDEQRILYRDRKFVIQVPYRTDYSRGTDLDRWNPEGRMRDKALMVRITYNPGPGEIPLELTSALTYFRYSFS